MAMFVVQHCAPMCFRARIGSPPCFCYKIVHHYILEDWFTIMFVVHH